MSPSRRTRSAIVTGVGATATMDLAGAVIQRATGVPPMDYGLLGRWLGHIGRGRFAHSDITEADPVRGERPLGWIAHYSIGVGFAAALVSAVPGWSRRPTLVPALACGIASAPAPLLILQPAFGMGVAASRTPEPRTARLRTLRTHAIYGCGLYLSGVVAARTTVLD